MKLHTDVFTIFIVSPLKVETSGAAFENVEHSQLEFLQHRTPFKELQRRCSRSIQDTKRNAEFEQMLNSLNVQCTMYNVKRRLSYNFPKGSPDIKKKR